MRTAPRRLVLPAVALLVLSGTLTACSDDTAVPAAGDSVLRLGASGEVPTFDPARQESGGDRVLKWSAVFDTLLHCERDGTVVPGAAETFELSEDATELTLRLREGMTFADGSPVDAEAAKASIEHMQQGGGSDSGRVAGMTVTVQDELGLQITAPKPTGQLPTFMCLAPGIIASPDQLAAGDIGSNPISSGPYEFDAARSTTGSVYTFTKRSDYWDADSFDYDTVVVTVMGDVTARLNALKSGQIDAANLQQPQIEDAQAAGIHVTRNRAAWAGLYLNDRAGERIPALGDVRVRRAINMVFDRQAIADGLFAGEAAPSTQIFNPEATAYQPELDELYPYDVSAAQQLMVEAGYPDGFTVEVPSQGGLGGTATYNPLISQQLALLDIEVVEVPLAGPTALSDILGGRFPIFWARIGTGDSMFDIVQSLQPDSIWNAMDTEDPELQPLLDRAQSARGAEAEEVYRDINRYVVEEAWFAPWVQDNSFVAVDREERLPEVNDQFRSWPKLSDFRR